MKKRLMIFFLLALILTGSPHITSTHAAPARAQEYLEEKWRALDEDTKNALCELLEKRAEDEIRLVEKLGQLGFLDPGICAGIIGQLREEIRRNRETDCLPGIFHQPSAPHSRRG